MTLGALLQGITVEGREYAGGWWDWLSLFSLLTGVSLVIGYGVLGATWLVMKTEGSLQDKAFRFAHIAGIALIVCVALVSAATPFLEAAYYEHWFAWPNILFTSQVPLLVVIAAVAYFFSLGRRYEKSPFLLALGLFALSMLGLGVSMFPRDRSGRDHHPRCRSPRLQPDLHACRGRNPDPDHPRLLGLFLLDIPRQGRRRRIPLMADAVGPMWWRRILWFIGLWLAGVATVAAVGYLIRSWLL